MNFVSAGENLLVTTKQKARESEVPTSKGQQMQHHLNLKLGGDGNEDAGSVHRSNLNC